MRVSKSFVLCSPYYRLVRWLLRHGWGEPDPDAATTRITAWFFVPMFVILAALILWEEGIYGL